MKNEERKNEEQRIDLNSLGMRLGTGDSSSNSNSSIIPNLNKKLWNTLRGSKERLHLTGELLLTASTDILHCVVSFNYL